MDAFGRVDVVICNAGILRMTPFPETTLEDFTRHFEVHVAGSFNIARSAWPHLAAQRYGRIVLTTSNGILGSPPLAAYASAKGGVLGMMRALAAAGDASGINVKLFRPPSPCSRTSPARSTARWSSPEAASWDDC